MQTRGRTRSGEVFVIPPTQDLLQALFYPKTPQTVFEWSVVVLIVLHVAVFVAIPLPRGFYLGLFVFWLCVANLGLGLILWKQSHSQWMVRLARRHGFGRNPGKKRGPWITYLIDQLLIKSSISEDVYNELPMEYIAWMLFRGIADLVLACDFISFILFAVSYFDAPPEITWRDWARYIAGAVLLCIHFLVKDYDKRDVKVFASYWGDFFFILEFSPKDSSIVVEMAPNSMYSTWRVGFYATALITKSYTVLFASLAAHAAQLVFLFLVETPHIEKVYKQSEIQSDKAHDQKILRSFFQRDLVIFHNFDWFRSSDVLVALVWIYSVMAVLIVGPIDPETAPWKLWYYLGHAVFWRVVYNGVLGIVLHLQSNHKFFSRHFIKYGETPNDAFRHWKIIFNLCQSMTYLSFGICVFRLYSPPDNWFEGTALLMHVVAVLSLGLHFYTAVSIHKTLGDFGWFYGDFFIDSLRDSRSLTYTGVYRFLNHPNAWAFTASAWGVTLACRSWPLFFLTAFSQASNWAFVRLVEAPHMKLRYGDQVRAPQEGQGGEGTLLGGVVESLGKGRERLRRVISSGGLRSMLWEGEDYSDGVDSENEIDCRETGAGRDDLMHTSISRLWNGAEVEDSDNDDWDGAETFLEESYGSEAGGEDSARRSPFGDLSPRLGRMSMVTDSMSLEVSQPIKITSNLKMSSVRRSKSQDDHSRDGVNAIVDNNSLLQGAKNIVKRRVESLANATQRSPPNIPLHLYTLTFPLATLLPVSDSTTSSSSSSHTRFTPRFRFSLGEHIVVQFTCARETLSRRDWIGIYRIGANVSRDYTISRSGGRWSFLSGLNKMEVDDDTETPMMRKLTPGEEQELALTTAGSFSISSSLNDLPSPTSSPSTSTSTDDASKIHPMLDPGRPSLLMFGKTLVSVKMSQDDQGLRIVTGLLSFKTNKLPWEVGLYEFRYHTDGGYSVVTLSETFEVTVDEFDWGSAGGGGGADDDDGLQARVEERLRQYVESCIDVDRLDLDDDIMTRCAVPDDYSISSSAMKKYRNEVARRVVYGIMCIFGIEFSWKAVSLLGTVRSLSKKIVEAQQALSI